ncbi:NEDD4-binding protein 2-like 2 isoform X2 [Gopherus flavomarginatus]|uniref:NEDD4-binding protein 2-like 2 isoform X2 n=1 Tax=Gopherus flavomarginatus TaxID=286002 RepID=UPI0021CBF06C|nr:NEDD4-binding protein 2-like 2 isoform X2 [Gopherus flavomarginatus]
MLHADCKVRPLEYEDEMTIEPCSKKIKSTEEAHDKSCNDGFQGSFMKTDTERINKEWIPLYVSDNQGKQEVQQKENENTDVLETSSEEFPGSRPGIIESTRSTIMQSVNLPIKEVTENKCPFITEKVDEANIKETSNKSFTVNGDEVEAEEHSTSQVFIGPVYRPVEENKQDKTRNFTKFSTGKEKQNTVLDNKIDKEEAKKIQTLSCDVSKIDDELCQFYKEIQQLESDKDELEGHLQEKETESSQERFIPSHEDEQDICYSRTQSYYDHEQCFYNEPSGQKTDSEPKCFDSETNGWRSENHFNWQVDSKFWNHSVPQFRPGWQPTQSFIIPQGPLLPRFNHHLDVQTLSSTPHQPNTLHSQNDGLPQKNYTGYHGNSGSTNRNCPLFDQNNSYAGHIGIHSMQVSRNGYSNQDGCMNNGFCETREECWKDPRTYQIEGIHNFNFQQFSEDKLCRSQKLLLILRGLPGSGKTTLSHILLGQNRDGVVFSTDDYFRQQDGYTYNVAQLGDAHDWNQKRAKQAMDQGRSPVIIDNTNTQAWEMKPYVEMALGKGYRVEFHEPDTWWKFDPEELEKVTDIKKKPGHRLSKAKQRRKRNRKMKHDNVKITEKKSDGAPCHLIPDDQETSDSEEKDSEEENRKSVFTFNGNPGDENCEDRSNGDCNESPKSTKHQTGSLPVAVSETSATLACPVKSDLFTEYDGPFLINLTSAPNKNLIEFEHTLDDQEVDHNQNKNLMVNESNSLDTNDHSSVLDTEYNSKENSSMMLNNQDELTLDQIASEPDLKSKLLNVSNGKKETLSLQHDLKTSEICVVLPDKTTKDRQTSKRNEKNPWAFFSVDLTDIQFQLGSDRSGSCSWPEGAHKFICEQRPKRVRRPKQTYPDSTVEQTHESNEELEKEISLQTLTEEGGTVTHGGLQSSLIDKVHNISFIESGVTVTNCLAEANVPSNVGTPVPSKKKGRCKRIFNLAPNFHLPRQIAVSTKEGQKDVLLMDDNLSENVLKTEQERIANKDSEKKSEQNLEFQEHLTPSNNDVTDSSLNHGVGSLLHSSQWGQSLCLSKKAVFSPAQKFPSSFCIVSSTSKEQITTFKQEKILDKKEDESEPFSSELTNSQPDILCSVKVTSDCPTYPNVFESCDEDMHKADESKPSQSSQIEANQDTLNTKSNFLGLPLSLGFAFQLVDLFGSPGFPLESLLPDDYIVPLDWKTSKKIHLLWKTSVERKQKKNGLENGSSLAVGANIVEDTNKDCQKSQESYETLPERNLYQDVVEENSVTYPDNKHLYNVSTNLECHLKQKKST